MMARRVMRHGGFKFPNETYCVFHSSLGICTERPIAQTKTAPDKVDERIKREQKLIPKITRKCEPLHSATARHYHVEFVTMNNQDAFACGGHMNCVLLDFNVPIDSTKTGHQFVVVSRDVNYACALACFAQNFLDDVVVLLRPVNSAPQRPDVDQVAHDVQRRKSFSRKKSNSAVALQPRVPRCASEIHAARYRLGASRS